MKKLAGFLAFSLLGAGVITAQNSISTPIIATNGNTVEAQLQNTENALATDGDVIIKDRRDPPKRKENLVDTKIEALIQMDNAVATDGDVIIKDRRKTKTEV